MTTTHVELLQALEAQFRPVLENSPDGVYLWLDDTHKVCNERLAAMFGYTVAEWCERPDFLGSFIFEEDQELYAANYQRSVAALTFPVTFRFRGRRKDGSTFSAETDMIPASFDGHAVAYHFVRQVGG
jgi:PAS domain S-box-containing protein